MTAVMARVLTLILALALVSSCGNTEPDDAAVSPSPSRSPSPSPSPSPVVPAVCDYADDVVREILKDIDAGTELPDELVDRLDAAQEVLVEQADLEADPDLRKALLSEEEALGQLKVGIADEGTNYTSGMTGVRLLGAKFTVQTVKVTADCQ